MNIVDANIESCFSILVRTPWALFLLGVMTVLHQNILTTFFTARILYLSSGSVVHVCSGGFVFLLRVLWRYYNLQVCKKLNNFKTVLRPTTKRKEPWHTDKWTCSIIVGSMDSLHIQTSTPLVIGLSMTMHWKNISKE